MKTVFIYALNCPTTGRTRYIGKTANPRQRLKLHLQKGQHPCYRIHWIESLLEKGLQPELEILDEVPESEWQQWEVAYIAFFREQGFDLVNGTLGGEGGATNTGKKCSPETKLKIGNANRGKTRTPETCAKLRALRLGKKFPSISAAMSGEKNPNFGKRWPGRGLTSAQCEALGIALRGKKKTPEHIAAMTKSKFGRKLKNNTSGFVGVSWNKATAKWNASFQVGKKAIFLGRFARIEDAVFVRALALDKYFS